MEIFGSLQSLGIEAGTGLLFALLLLLLLTGIPLAFVTLLVTLIFGLIHGFGFAADLLESRLPREKLAEILVGFNLGVEIGQLTVVLAVTGLVVLARRLRLATPRAITVDVLASGLVAIGMYWFVSRSFAGVA